jgi:hypothetical protein
MSRCFPLSPLRAVANGLVAGAIGTAAMDLVRYAQYRLDGGEQGFMDWESAADVRDWDGAPPPAQVGKRVIEGLFMVELPSERASLMTNVVHWAYGSGLGGAYGAIAGSLPELRLRHGLAFGGAVWLSGYVVLPLAKLYEPIWRYDAVTLAKDLCGHLAYGVGTTAAFRALAGR